MATKRQRREHPLTLADNESLSCVASPYGPIHTPLTSSLTKEIVFERLKKEIVDRFGLTLSVPRLRQHIITKSGQLKGKDRIPREKKERTENTDPKIRLLRSRMLFGVNQCTRALETIMASKKPEVPSLVVSSPSPGALILLGRDLHPPTILSHIPLLAKETNTPILLLPGKASAELGAVLGIKKVGILLFLPRADDDDKISVEDARLHSQIDSFIEFTVSKLPTEDPQTLLPARKRQAHTGVKGGAGAKEV
jgi:RNase P subunit Pop3